jgi:cysteine desulfurase
MSRHTAYLDHNATTPLDENVLKAMLPYLTNEWGNPSSVHEWGQQARYGLEKARLQVAVLAGAPEEGLIFTSGGTEANNTLLRSVAMRHAGEGCHIVSSSIEHPSIRRCLEQLTLEGLAEVTYLDPDPSGVVDPDAYREATVPTTRLFTLMYANNETGAIQPVEELCRIGQELGVPVHTDAIQALGKIPLNLIGAGLSFASFSAHKLYGPKGIGAFYARDISQVSPLLQGGGQEMNLRAGTENVPGIVGFGAAAVESAKILSSEMTALAILREELEDLLVERILGTHILSREADRLPGTLCVCFEGVYGTYVVLDLAEEGIAVSSGSACSANQSEPSYVLLAMGIEPALAQGAVRFSLGRLTTREQIQMTAEVAARVIVKQRANPPRFDATMNSFLACD